MDYESKMEERVKKLEAEVAELCAAMMVLLEEDEELDPLEEQHQEFAAHVKAARDS